MNRDNHNILRAYQKSRLLREQSESEMDSHINRNPENKIDIDKIDIGSLKTKYMFDVAPDNDLPRTRYFDYGKWKDGRELTDDELEDLTSEQNDLLYYIKAPSFFYSKDENNEIKKKKPRTDDQMEQGLEAHFDLMADAERDMREDNEENSPDSCPSCGKPLKMVTRDYTFETSKGPVTVSDLKFKECESCKDAVFPSEASNRIDDAVRNAKSTQADDTKKPSGLASSGVSIFRSGDPFWEGPGQRQRDEDL